MRGGGEWRGGNGVGLLFSWGGAGGVKKGCGRASCRAKCEVGAERDGVGKDRNGEWWVRCFKSRLKIEGVDDSGNS